MTLNEMWLPIQGYEGFYEVSNMGQVRSILRIDIRGRERGGHILRPGLNTQGYPVVVLCKDGLHKTQRVHRLVAAAFIPNPNNYPHINHINHTRTDARALNLEWCTRSMNMKHCAAHGRASRQRPIIATSLSTGEQIRYPSQCAAAIDGFFHSAISRCIHGGLRQYKGFTWTFDDSTT
jgi:hypothetical protein